MSSGLGPHLIGQRVVVRRMLPGETGPSGGPAMTDLLGVMESWSEGSTAVRDDSGAVTVIAVEHIVAGKAVPPRAPRRQAGQQAFSDAETERRATLGWPAQVAEPLGEWLLRASGGFSARGNSVLAAGDPGVPFETAVSRTVGFYAARDLLPLAQVVVGGEAHVAFEAAGWVSARPGRADTMFQVASVSRALPRVRRALPADPADVATSTSASAAWLADDEDALSHPDSAVAVLEGPDDVVFAAVHDPGRLDDREIVVAKGRCSLADGWLGISDVAVSPSQRRRGLARVVVAALLEWGAERGATTVYLQTRGDNTGALALYESMGFATHHTYRYLTQRE